ncbi:13896_t:CDS:2 [Dentiscutata erythropus]|uniref:13896_t:CDS:1 n=1 Tax=Dentiscutata erythropus TaxID=1348616 RepID=A0A9N9HFB7_9GLOM|nr:13896_t:CDS:2 [Dentiscutata erythropus]
MPSVLEKSSSIPFRYHFLNPTWKTLRNFVFLSLTLAIIIFLNNPQTELIIKKSPLHQESHTNNVIIVVDGKNQATSLQPMYCKLSKKSGNNIFVNVVVTGKERGMCGEEFKELNSKSSKCRVSVHDLDIKNSSLSDDAILSSVFKETIHVINKIKPVVLIYAKDLKDKVMRGVDAATLATSQLNEKFTKIAIPIEYIKNVKFIADLPVEALKHWNTPKFHIQVVTQNRPASLKRLVDSLNSSIYLGDNVHLTINIDEDADPKTLEYTRNLEWRFGEKKVRHRLVQGGLVAAIVESFYPADNDDYGFILEDDIELSPFYYIWAKYNILKYRYGPDRILSNRMFGVSLYNSKHIELTLPKHKQFNAALVLDPTQYDRRSPYLCQIPCSWGSVVFPEIWREFHQYITARLKDINGPNLQEVIVPDSRSNRWHNSWKRFFIELIYLRGYVMLYPNYNNFVSFSTNHHEEGVHVHLKGGKPRKGFLLPLMKKDTISGGLPKGGLPDYRNLPIMDLFGRVVTLKKIVDRGHELHNQISLCPPSNSAPLTYDPKDLLCIDEKKKIRENSTSNDQNSNLNININLHVGEKDNEKVGENNDENTSHVEKSKSKKSKKSKKHTKKSKHSKKAKNKLKIIPNNDEIDVNDENDKDEEIDEVDDGAIGSFHRRIKNIRHLKQIKQIEQIKPNLESANSNSKSANLNMARKG